MADPFNAPTVLLSPTVTLAMGSLVMVGAILAIRLGIDVRLSLTASAVILGLLARQPMVVVNTLLRTMADEKFIVPICSAMAFAHLLRYAGCDQHLVTLLVRPLRRVRWFLVPGAVLVGFLVNIPVISQTSTAVTIGSVLIPLLRSAQLSPLTIGATLLLGSSVGGELLNPGAPELETVSKGTGHPTTELVGRVLPLVLVQLSIAAALFWAWVHWSERRPVEPSASGTASPPPEIIRVSLLKAAVPVLPVVLLFLVGRPWEVIRIPHEWLVTRGDASHFDSRLVGVAMVIAAAAAAATARRSPWGAVQAYARGLVYAYGHIITLIIAATAFGKGVELIGMASLIGQAVSAAPGLLTPAAGFLPLAFAGLCGSGMASTQSLFGFFVEPSSSLGMDPTTVGAVVSLGAAAGRTMSPVAAVTLMCSALTGADPVALARRVALPLLIGMVAVVLVGARLAVR